MDLQDHFHVMKPLSKTELVNITGGNITGSLINAFTSAFKLVHDIGKSLGSSIMRIKENKICEIE